MIMMRKLKRRIAGSNPTTFGHVDSVIVCIMHQLLRTSFFDSKINRLSNSSFPGTMLAEFHNKIQIQKHQRTLPISFYVTGK